MTLKEGLSPSVFHVTDIGYLLKEHGSVNFIRDRALEEIEEAVNVTPDRGSLDCAVEGFENSTTDVSIGANRQYAPFFVRHKFWPTKETDIDVMSEHDGLGRKQL
jgi:hypothetical protein